MLIIGQLANCQRAMKYIKKLCPETADNESATFAHSFKSNLIVQNLWIQGLSVDLDMNYSTASSQWRSQSQMTGATSSIQSCRLAVTNGLRRCLKNNHPLQSKWDMPSPGCDSHFQSRGARVLIRLTPPNNFSKYSSDQ